MTGSPEPDSPVPAPEPGTEPEPAPEHSSDRLAQDAPDPPREAIPTQPIPVVR